jgi:LCP family protein required for cell wall assembly
MEPKQISPTKRKIMIVLLVIIGIISILFISGYLYIHSYINKMNLVTASKKSNAIIAEELESEAEDLATKLEEVEPELEEDQETPDSPEEEISTIENEIRKNMEESSTPIVYDKEVFNVLLIGGDSREAGGTGRSDAMILVSINKKTETITVTSLLRDIYLQIPGKYNNRINVAYAVGGADLLMETIEQNFKIKIDRYASIDFYAFIDVVDAIGGVTLEVTEKEIPVINDYINEMNRLTGQEGEKDNLTTAGTLLLNGKQALGYSRNRYVGNSDFERTARQRRVLEQIFNQVKASNLIELQNLLGIILPQVTTNLSEGEIFTLILSLPAYINYDIDQWSVPMSNSYSSLRIRGMSVLGIDFEENISELHKRIYGEDIEIKGK